MWGPFSAAAVPMVHAWLVFVHLLPTGSCRGLGLASHH